MTRAYLCLVHPDQALVDFGPGRNSADVPQLVGVFGKGTRLHLQEKNQSKKNETGIKVRRVFAKTQTHTHIHTYTPTRKVQFQIMENKHGTVSNYL